MVITNTSSWNTESNLKININWIDSISNNIINITKNKEFYYLETIQSKLDSEMIKVVIKDTNAWDNGNGQIHRVNKRLLNRIRRT